MFPLQTAEFCGVASWRVTCRPPLFVDVSFCSVKSKASRECPRADTIFQNTVLLDFQFN